MRTVLVVVLALLLVGPGVASAHHRPGHSGGPRPPTSPSSDPCAVSLQQRINDTPAGGTLSLPACLYREMVTVKGPIRIFGGFAAEIRGSDVWSSWNGRTSTQQLPAADRGHIDPQFNVPTCSDGTHTTCNSPYHVFYDGAWLKNVDGAPGHLEFTVDGSRRVVLGNDPQGHRVEVATRALWIDFSRSRGVYIHGLTFRHSIGSYQTCSTRASEALGLTLEQNTLVQAGYCALGVADSDSTRLLGNELSWNGGTALAAARATNLEIAGGRVRWNNRRAAAGESRSDYWYGWAAGGFKIWATHDAAAVVRDVDASYNGGPGIWFDGGNRGGVIRGNRATNNLAHGIEVEGNYGPFRVEGNVSAENGWCGIMVAQNTLAPTESGTVRDNTVTGNGHAGVCRGYNHQEVQPNVVYANNGPQ